MIYNNINEKLITTGTAKKFNDVEDKWITPLYYDGGEFVFSLKNKYIKVDSIEESNYGKDFITIKSKEYSSVIETIVKKLGVDNPIQTDGSFRATINSKTKSSEPLDKLKDQTFTACISLSFPTTYSDSKVKTLQIHVKDLVVVKIFNDDLEVDFDKLELAI